MLKRISSIVIQVLGIDFDKVSHHERWLSIAGGFVSIYALILISWQFVQGWSAALIISSVGSTAVLLFAVPHGKLSQPWAVIGGHLISAFIGVSCSRYIPDTGLAAATAVGLAIGAMHYLRCIHPPAGATALAAVIGSQQLHDLGYQFVVTPVLANVLIILVIAVLFNLPFATRRYPQALQTWFEHRLGEVLAPQEQDELDRQDINHAIKQMDLVVDVSDEDLLKLFHLANAHARQRHLLAEQILLGHYYSNGGSQWSVRRIIDESVDRNQVIYRVVAGKEERGTGICTLEEFARWSRYEVVRDGNQWQPLSKPAE